MKSAPRLFFIASVISSALGLITLPAYTHLLQVEQMGKFIVYSFYGNTIVSFLSCALSTYVYRSFFNKDLVEFKILFSSIFIILNISILLILLFVYYLNNSISFFIFQSNVDGYILNFSLLFGFINFFFLFLMIIINAKLDGKFFLIISCSKIIFEFLLSIYLINFNYLDDALLNRIYSSLISSIIFYIILLIYLRTYFCKEIKIKYFIQGVKFSYPDILNSSLGMISSTFDKTYLTRINTTLTGLYSISEKFSLPLKILGDSISKVFNNFFLLNSEYGENGKKAIIEKYNLILPYYLFIAVFFLTFSQEFLILITPVNYHESSKYIWFFFF